MAAHQTQHCSEHQIISSWVDTTTVFFTHSISRPKVIGFSPRVQSGICDES
jgi:hypothetical protein